MNALAKASRAFVLYDSGNELIRKFLADYEEQARKALAAHGAITFEVGPHEILVGGEVVYAERDRERSLAFRLFRDGVRQVTFDPAVRWEELLQLLEILAVRFSGIRQQEEDVVTLLEKAEFSGISIVAVEGFAPEEEQPEPDAAKRSSGAPVAPPEGWDRPAPRLPQPVPLAYRPVAAEALAALREEEGAEGLVAAALAAVREVLAEAARAAWPLPDPDLLHLLAEVRDFLLGEGQLRQLLQLAELVRRFAPEGALRAEIERGLGDARAVAMMLAAIPADASALPQEFLPLLPFLRIEPLLDLLAREESAPRRRLLVELSLGRLPAEADALVERLPGLDAAMAGELLRGLAARAPDRIAAAALKLLEQPDTRLRLEALRALESGSGELHAGPLLPLLSSEEEPLRIRAAELLGKRKVASAFEPLAQALQERKGVSLREAEAFGRALGQLAPIPAGHLFSQWLDPRRGMLRRMLSLSQHQKALQWAAVAGLGQLPGAEPQARIQALAEQAEPELRRHCFAVLARRRHEGLLHG